MSWLKDLRTNRPVLGEIVKQAIDQPLHILMTVGSIWGIGALVFWGIFAEWNPEYRLLASVIAGGTLTSTWVVAREWYQWPSSRWWDPPLDWLFEAGGIALGVYSFFSILG